MAESHSSSDVLLGGSPDIVYLEYARNSSAEILEQQEHTANTITFHRFFLHSLIHLALNALISLDRCNREHNEGYSEDSRSPKSET